MKFILEWKSFEGYKEGDIINIKYWYNKMITPVKILEKKGRTYKVTHNIPQSKIRNAPEETIKNSEIISIYRLS